MRVVVSGGVPAWWLWLQVIQSLSAKITTNTYFRSGVVDKEFMCGIVFPLNISSSLNAMRNKEFEFYRMG